MVEKHEFYSVYRKKEGIMPERACVLVAPKNEPTCSREQNFFFANRSREQIALGSFSLRGELC